MSEWFHRHPSFHALFSFTLGSQVTLYHVITCLTLRKHSPWPQKRTTKSKWTISNQPSIYLKNVPDLKKKSYIFHSVKKPKSCDLKQGEIYRIFVASTKETNSTQITFVTSTGHHSLPLSVLRLQSYWRSDITASRVPKTLTVQIITCKTSSHQCLHCQNIQGYEFNTIL